MSETQQHPLKDGTAITLHVNGLHQYWTDDDPVKRPSVTGLVGFTDAGSFGAGMGYAIKLAEQTGNPHEAREQSAIDRKAGEEFHAHVDNFIRHGTVAEDPVFLAWYNEVGMNRKWLASETLVFHPDLKYGGTADAISLEAPDADGQARTVLWDWKTTSRSSWEAIESYGPNKGKQRGSSLRWMKDGAQVAGYAQALQAMGSVYEIDKAFICYVMRDGSYTVTVQVNLGFGRRVFDASRTMFMLQKEVR